MDSILPETMYAEVAPFPVPMAQHLYHSFLQSATDPLDVDCFWEELQEKRRYIYAYMDSFVRNRDGQLPRQLRYTTQWLRENLGQLATHFKKLLQENNLPQLHIHDLRHSASTLLAKMGVPAKVIQEILGHSSIVITQNLYGHVIAGMQEEAMQKMDAIFRKEDNG